MTPVREERHAPSQTGLFVPCPPFELAMKSTSGDNFWCSSAAGLAVLALLLVAAPVRGAGADGGFIPRTGPELLRATRQVLEHTDLDLEGESVLVLDRQTHFELDADGRQTATRRVVYVFLSDDTEGWETVSAGWSPWHQERPTILARVVDAAGVERRLDPATLSETTLEDGNPATFSDRRVLEAPLPGVGRGAVVETATVVRDTEPFFSAGTVTSESLATWTPTIQGRVVVSHPESLPVRYEVQGGGQEITEQRGGGFRVLAAQMAPVGDRWVYESHLPFDQPAVPFLLFSTAESWSDVASSYAEVVERALGAAGTKAALGVSPKLRGSLHQRVDSALAWLWSEVRYTGLELGKAAIVPRSPVATLQRGYGDCKDQATLLTALLRRGGLDAHVALLDAGEDWEASEQLPGLGQFDHAIVYVDGEEPLWIDPTSSGTPAGEIPFQDQGRLALIARPGERELRRTPVLDAAVNRLEETRTVKLPEYGTGSLTEISRYTGELARSIRPTFQGARESDLPAMLTDYARRMYLTGEIADARVGAIEEHHQPFELEFLIDEAPRFVTDLGQAVAALTPSAVTASVPPELLVRDGIRQNDYVLPYPRETTLRYLIDVPRSLELRSLPETRSVEQGGVRFSESYRQQDDGVVEAVFELSLPHREMSAEDFNAARVLLSEISEREPLLVWFDHAASVLAAEGRVADAVDRFRQLIEEQPEQAAHRVRMSRVLLGAGMKAAAVEHAERAVELQPASALAHWNLGLTHLHGDDAVRYGAGFDYDEARAHLARAAELAPDSLLFRSELAILLDHDRRGRQFGRDADLGAAVVEHFANRETFQRSDFDVNLLQGLVRLGRFEEAISESAEMEASTAIHGLRVAALAARSGAEAAMHEARALAASPEERSSLLVEAGRTLFQIGLLDDARELLPRAAHGLPPEGRSFIDLLTRAGPFPERPPSPEDPASVVRHLLHLVVSQSAGLRTERDPLRLTDFLPVMHPLLVERSLEEEGVARPEDLGESILDLGGLDEDAIFHGEAGAALLYSMFDIEVEGDDRVGHRARLVVAGQTVGSFIVSRSSGEHRILATSAAPPTVGHEVLHRLAEGRPDAAAQWLDWFRQDLSIEASTYRWPDLFRELWKPAGPRDEEAMRIAAAALLLDSARGDVAQRDLEEALELLVPRLTTPAAEAERLVGLLVRALVESFLEDDRFEDVLRVTSLPELDQSEWLGFRALALHRSGQPDAARQVVDGWLEKGPDRPHGPPCLLPARRPRLRPGPRSGSRRRAAPIASPGERRLQRPGLVEALPGRRAGIGSRRCQASRRRTRGPAVHAHAGDGPRHARSPRRGLPGARALHGARSAGRAADVRLAGLRPHRRVSRARGAGALLLRALHRRERREYPHPPQLGTARGPANGRIEARSAQPSCGCRRRHSVACS